MPKFQLFRMRLLLKFVNFLVGDRLDWGDRQSDNSYIIIQVIKFYTLSPSSISVNYQLTGNLESDKYNFHWMYRV